jgi:hypothetical protein
MYQIGIPYNLLRREDRGRGNCRGSREGLFVRVGSLLGQESLLSQVMFKEEG